MSPCSATRSHCNEKPSLSATRESPCAASKTQYSQKKKKPATEFPGSLVVRIPGFHCGGLGSVLGLETEILQAVGCGHKTCSSTVLPLPGVNASGAISVLNLVCNLDGLEAHFFKKKSPAKLIYKKLCANKVCFCKSVKWRVSPQIQEEIPLSPSLSFSYRVGSLVLPDN